MTPQALQGRLSRIQTRWSLLLQPGQLLLCYYGAVFRYLLGVVRDPEAAEELCQEFAVRMLRGDYQRADRDKGRYRDFLKTSLRHLVIDYWRHKNREKKVGMRPLPEDDVAPDPSCQPEAERAFLDGWREELLARTWEALSKAQQQQGTPFYTVLRFKVDHPRLRSADLANHLAESMGRKLSATAMRQVVHRARELFAKLLLEEVRRSLPPAEHDHLEGELIELGLLEYCRPALRPRLEKLPKQ